MKFKLIIDKSKDEEVLMTVHEITDLAAQIEALVTRQNRPEYLAGHLDEDIHMLHFDEIACITVLDGKTTAVDTDGKQYLIRMRLYEAEQAAPQGFFRINKSAIANERNITRFAATIGGGVDAVFRGGYREYVSRRCFAEIKRRFEGK